MQKKDNKEEGGHKEVIGGVIEETKGYYDEKIKPEKEKLLMVLKEKKFKDLFTENFDFFNPKPENIINYIKANAYINAAIFLSNEKDENLLFDMDARFEDDLTGGIISKDFKNVFNNKGSPLSEKAFIDKKADKWMIVDKDEEKKNIYIIKKEEGKLNVYENSRYKQYSELFKKLSHRPEELKKRLKDFDKIKIFTFSFPGIETTILLQISIIKEIMDVIIDEYEKKLVEYGERLKENKEQEPPIKLGHFFVDDWYKDKRKGIRESEFKINKDKIESFIMRIILNKLQEKKELVDKLPTLIGKMVEMVDEDNIKGEIGNKEIDDNFLDDLCKCINENRDEISEFFGQPIRKTTLEIYRIEDIKEKLKEGKITKYDFKEKVSINIVGESIITKEELENRLKSIGFPFSKVEENGENKWKIINNGERFIEEFIARKEGKKINIYKKVNQWLLHILCLARELERELEEEKKTLYIFTGAPHILYIIVPAFEILKECIATEKEIIVYPIMTGEGAPPIVPMLEYTPMTYKSLLASDIFRCAFIMYHRGGEKLTDCYLAHLFEPAFELIEVVGNINGPICPECEKPTIITKLECDVCQENHWLFYCNKCCKPLFKLEMEIAYLMFTLEIFSKLDYLFMKSVYMFIQEYSEETGGLGKGNILLVRTMKNAENNKVIEEIVNRIKNKYLFGMDAGLEKEVNKKSVSGELVQEFENKGFSLSKGAVINEEEDNGWKIEDKKGNTTYIIMREENGDLNVYDNIDKWLNEVVKNKEKDLNAYIDWFIELLLQTHR